jgi:hypothetical protein
MTAGKAITPAIINEEKRCCVLRRAYVKFIEPKV